MGVTANGRASDPRAAADANLVAMTHGAPRTTVDIDALREQLASRPVAFETDNPVNEQLGRDLTPAVESVADSGRVGMIVLETVPERRGDLRDIAQDVQLATDLDTVIARTPMSVSVVSDSMSRAQIERAEVAMVQEPDYTRGVELFAAEAHSYSPQWIVIGMAIVAILAAAAVSTYASARDRHVSSTRHG